MLFGRLLELISGNLQAGLVLDRAIAEATAYLPSFNEAFPLFQKKHVNLTETEELMQRLLDSGDERIMDFSGVLRVAMKAGGNPVPIFRHYVHELNLEADLQREMKDDISKKVFELRIMQAFPYLMYAYVDVIYSGYFTVLYEESYGRVMMLLCSALYFWAWFMSEDVLYRKEMNRVFRRKTLRERLYKETFYKDYAAGKSTENEAVRDFILSLSTDRVRNLLSRLYQVEDENLVYCFVFTGLKRSLLVILGGCLVFGISVYLKAIKVQALGTVLILLFSILLLAFLYYEVGELNLYQYGRERENEITEDFVSIVEKLTLLQCAGLTVRSAIKEIVTEYEGTARKRYAYEEIVLCNRKLGYGISEVNAYTELGERCGTAEFRHLSMLLIQNMNQGNEALTELLSQEVEQGLSIRLSDLRRKGLRNETKLLFPTVLYLFVILLFLMVPAFAQFIDY